MGRKHGAVALLGSSMDNLLVRRASLTSEPVFLVDAEPQRGWVGGLVWYRVMWPPMVLAFVETPDHSE